MLDMITKNIIYDVAIIGAGAAGCMAAIRASQLGQTVILIERNESIGYKILLTSNGRCNLTNTASLDIFLTKFSPNPKFYRTAFFKFFNPPTRACFVVFRDLIPDTSVPVRIPWTLEITANILSAIGE